MTDLLAGLGMEHDRIRTHTPSEVNDRIDDAARGRLQRLRASGDREAVVRRIAELDQEWDLDRALMVLFPAVGSVVLHLGLTRHSGWLHVLRAQMGFLAWHAAMGWCPPVSLLRRLGYRSRPEIESEKDALRAMISRPVPALAQALLGAPRPAPAQTSNLAPLPETPRDTRRIVPAQRRPD